MHLRRAWLLGVLVLAACGSKDAPPPQPAPVEHVSVTDPIGFCARARVLVQGRRTCFPEDSSLQMALDELDGYIASAPTDPAARREVAKKCARMLDGMMRAQQPANCPLSVPDSEVRELADFLAAPRAPGSAAPAP